MCNEGDEKQLSRIQTMRGICLGRSTSKEALSELEVPVSGSLSWYLCSATVGFQVPETD